MVKAARSGLFGREIGGVRERGATILEVLTVVGILGVLLVSLTFGLNRSRSMESVQAAELVAEELRALRAKAQSEGMPTGLVIPRTPEGYATGYYLVEGYGPPRVARVRPWDGDFAHVYMMAGGWSGAAGMLPAANGVELDLTTWTLPVAGDYVLAFEPSGRLTTNVPSWLGQTCLLFATNVTIGGGGPSAARGLVSVCVSPDGLVSVQNGLPDGTNLAGMDGDGGRSQNRVLPAVTPPPSGSPPAIDQMVNYPKRSPSLPADIEASVQVGQYLRLEVQASDPDGGPLTIRWQATRLNGQPDTGQFSGAATEKMRWSGGAWRSVCEWTPPSDSSSASPEEFVLECTVEDPEGNQVQGRLGTSAGKVWALRDGLVLWDTQRFGGRVIMAANSDGSDPHRLTPPGVNAAYPKASPFGDCIAFTSWSAGLFVMNRDGTDIRLVTLPPPGPKTDIFNLCWSPDGTKLAFSVREYNPSPMASVLEDLYVVGVDGSGLRLVAQDLPVTYNQGTPMGWGFTGINYVSTDWSSQYLLYSQDAMGPGLKQTLRFALDPALAPSPSLPYTNGGSPVWDLQFSIDCRKAVGIEGFQLCTYDIDPLTGDLANPVPTSVDGYHPAFSYDGSRVTYTHWTGSGGELWMMDTSGTNQQPISQSGWDQGGNWLVGGGLIE